MRTTPDAVAAIIEVDDAITLTPFIESASAVVDDVCVPLLYDATRLELIERWLSAHFYALRDPRRSSEGASGVSASYQNAVDLGFNCTHYGQAAMRLDTRGGLAALEKLSKQGGRRTVGVYHLVEDDDSE